MKKAVLVLTALLAVAAGMRAARASDPATEMRAEDERMVQTRMATMGPMDQRMLDASPLQTTPVILGEVAEWTEHSVTVNTARGEHMTFETDSRTVMPASFRTGDPVKIEFHLMDNGMHHAGRIATINSGSQDWARLQQQLAYRNQNPNSMSGGSGYVGSSTSTDMNHQTGGGGAMNESTTTSGSDNTGTATGSDMSNTTNTNGMDQTNTNGVDQNTSNGADQTNNGTALPRTGSNRSWMLVLGLGAFAAAFGQRMFRRSA